MTKSKYESQSTTLDNSRKSQSEISRGQLNNLSLSSPLIFYVVTSRYDSGLVNCT